MPEVVYWEEAVPSVSKSPRRYDHYNSLLVIRFHVLLARVGVRLRQMGKGDGRRWVVVETSSPLFPQGQRRASTRLRMDQPVKSPFFSVE